MKLKANVLSKEYIFVKSRDAAYLPNNYTWGLSVQLPLFLVNARESKLLELLQKQTMIRIKYPTASYQLRRAAGMLQ